MHGWKGGKKYLGIVYQSFNYYQPWFNYKQKCPNFAHLPWTNCSTIYSITCFFSLTWIFLCWLEKSSELRGCLSTNFVSWSKPETSWWSDKIGPGMGLINAVVVASCWFSFALLLLTQYNSEVQPSNAHIRSLTTTQRTQVTAAHKNISWGRSSEA